MFIVAGNMNCRINWAPYIELCGEEQIHTFQLGIVFKIEFGVDVFDKVRFVGIDYSLDEWHSKFSSLDPQAKET